MMAAKLPIDGVPSPFGDGWPGRAERHSFAAACALIIVATVLLLLPAMLAGRPFIYWDTPTFYGWGHDIVAAIRDPWPASHTAFPDRGLWAADNYPGAWARITAQQFDLVMTAIGARSSFYAVPFYLLGSTLTLWAPAVAQAFLVSWAVWVTMSVTVPNVRSWEFIGLVAALTALTAAPFFAAFLMPDIFAALALLMTCLLLCFHGRLSRWRRIGCGTLLVASIVVHLSVLPTVAALLMCSAVIVRLVAPCAPVWRGAAAVTLALACAGIAAEGSDIGMRAAFGESVRAPPFLEGRVIADGPGQQFLQETCARAHWAACRWKDMHIVTTDDIIWPDVTWHNLPLITDPLERRRFLDEQQAIVLGTLRDHPAGQVRASAANAARQLAKFTIAYDVGGSLNGLLGVNTDRTMRVMQIVPNIAPCLAKAAACDDAQVLRYVQDLHYIVVLAASLLVGAALVRELRPRGRARAPESRALIAFTLVVVVGVILNGIVCGAFSGPWGRYQARVVWLVPMTAMLLLATWKRHSKANNTGSLRADSDAI